MALRHALPAAALAVLVAACGRDEAPAAPAAPAPEMQRVVDESDIARTLAAVDDAVDRKDWTETRLYFADELDVDFSSLSGAPGRIPASQLIDDWQKTLGPDKPSFHLRGDQIVKIDGDTALVTAHGYSWTRLPARKDNDTWEVWGVWEHRLVRTPQGWRITGMKFVKTYERGDPGIREAAQ